MAEVKRIYRQTMPKMKFIGRCYTNKDKVNGTFSEKWSEWFKNNLFEPLKLPETNAKSYVKSDGGDLYAESYR